MGSNSGAVCLPSRAMLMTGSFVQNLAKVPAAIDINDKTMPEVLKTAGYTTFGTGKWHNGRQAFSRSFTNGANIFMGGMSNHLKVPLYDFDETGEYPRNKTYYEDKFSSVIFREAAVGDGTGGGGSLPPSPPPPSLLLHDIKTTNDINNIYFNFFIL